MRSLVLPLALVLAAAPAAAQEAAVAPVPTVAPVSAVAPMPAVEVVPAVPVAPASHAAAVGLRPAAAPAVDYAAEARAAAPRRRGYGRDVALMVTGGAAILLGLVAGDTGGNLLVVGGAVIGGIGLYNFLQ